MRLLLHLILSFTQIYCYSVQCDDSYLSNTVGQASAEGQVVVCFFTACPSLALFHLLSNPVCTCYCEDIVA